MMEIVSARWSSRLRTKDTGKEARVPGLGGHHKLLQTLPWRATCPALPLPCSVVVLD